MNERGYAILGCMREPTVDELQQRLYEMHHVYVRSTPLLRVRNLRWLIATTSWKVITDAFAVEGCEELLSVFGISVIPIDAEPGYIQLIDVVNNRIAE